MLKLRPKRIPMRVGNKYIAIVNEETAKELDIRAADRVDIKVGRRDLTAILDISEGKELNNNEVGLFAETWDKLKVKKGDKIRICIAPKPESDKFITKKVKNRSISSVITAFL